MEKVRIGIFGLGRGGFAREYCSKAGNAEIVAVCDRNQTMLDRYKQYGYATYDNWDDFINHDGLDAVVLANFATEHAPFAIKAMKAGKHVLSEVNPFNNLKEGIELIEAVEETGKVYAYAENYCYMPCNIEMTRLIRSGEIGNFEYGEGEYLHNCEPGWAGHTASNPNHWRNHMYSTFYCTHSIGPLVHNSGQRPVKVTGFEVAHNDRMKRMNSASGPIGIEMIEFENGGIGKSIHGVGVSKNSYWFCLYGSKGRAESLREATGEHQNIKFVHTNIDEYEGQNIYFNEKMYQPLPSSQMSLDANSLGHGGGDFFTMYHFCEKILGRENDSIDVYEAADMFLCGMFAYRSILAGGIPMRIPNLRDKAERDLWRDDTASTDAKTAGDLLLPENGRDHGELSDKIKALLEKSAYKI